jgi:hypothetical protein
LINSCLNSLYIANATLIGKAMKFVQLAEIRDIVMLVASSPTTNVIQHMKWNDKHLYFIVGGTLSQVFLYFVKLDEGIDGSFIIYNSYSGEISVSDSFNNDPNMNSFPIIEIKNQDLLPEDVLAKVSEF